MEIRKYEALKAAGKAELKRVGADAFEVHLARFKEEDGTPDAPRVYPFTRSGLEHALGVHEQAITDHRDEIAGIRKILAVVDAMPVPAEAEAETKKA